MSRKKPVLSEVLEGLKKYKNGVLLNKLITIIYADEDSERVLKSAKLRDLTLNSKCNTYKVLHYYQMIFNPDVIKIWVSRE